MSPFWYRIHHYVGLQNGLHIYFIIYTGGATEIVNYDIENLGKSGNIMLTFINAYFNKGHTVYIDKWYAGRTLSFHLFANHRKSKS